MSTKMDISVEGIRFQQLTSAQLSKISDSIRVFVLGKQAAHVRSSGRDVGEPWAPLRPLTMDWKESRGINEKILHGRTGKLIFAIQRPDVSALVSNGQVDVTIEIGRNLDYTEFVAKGWTQTLTGSHAAGLFKKEGIRARAGTTFTAQPRELFGFTEEELTEFSTATILDLLGVNKTRTSIVGRAFSWIKRVIFKR